MSEPGTDAPLSRDEQLSRRNRRTGLALAALALALFLLSFLGYLT